MKITIVKSNDGYFCNFDGNIIEIKFERNGELMFIKNKYGSFEPMAYALNNGFFIDSEKQLLKAKKLYEVNL